MNAIAKALHFRFERNRRGWLLRFYPWLEISSGWGLAIGVYLWGDEPHYSLHLHLGWPNTFIRLPLPAPTWDGDGRRWGFSLFEGNVHLHWGKQTWVKPLPWDWTWYRTSYLLARGDGLWLHERRGDRPARKDNYTPYRDLLKQVREELQWKAEYPYRYELRSGEIQERIATVTVQEMEHRRRCLCWFPRFARVNLSILVDFNDEVGERTGSWKGGVLGCGYELRPDETPEQALRRMEKERKFT